MYQWTCNKYISNKIAYLKWFFLFCFISIEIISSIFMIFWYNAIKWLNNVFANGKAWHSVFLFHYDCVFILSLNGLAKWAKKERENRSSEYSVAHGRSMLFWKSKANFFTWICKQHFSDFCITIIWICRLFSTCVRKFSIILVVMLLSSVLLFFNSVLFNIVHKHKRDWLSRSCCFNYSFMQFPTAKSCNGMDLLTPVVAHSFFCACVLFWFLNFIQMKKEKRKKRTQSEMHAELLV